MPLPRPSLLHSALVSVLLLVVFIGGLVVGLVLIGKEAPAFAPSVEANWNSNASRPVIADPMPKSLTWPINALPCDQLGKAVSTYAIVHYEWRPVLTPVFAEPKP